MNMEFKGTKGKWEVLKDEFFNSTTVKHKAFSVCVVNNLTSNDICQANALLISKAPEMLEMLKKHLGILYDIEMEDSGDNIYIKNLIIETKQIIKEATEL